MYLPALETLATLSEGLWLASIAAKAKSSSPPAVTGGTLGYSLLTDGVLAAMEETTTGLPHALGGSGSRDEAAALSEAVDEEESRRASEAVEEFVNDEKRTAHHHPWEREVGGTQWVANIEDEILPNSLTEAEVFERFSSISWQQHLYAIFEAGRAIRGGARQGALFEAGGSGKKVRDAVLSNWAARAVCGLGPLGMRGPRMFFAKVPTMLTKTQNVPSFWDPDCQQVFRDVVTAIGGQGPPQTAVMERGEEKLPPNPAQFDEDFLSPPRIIARMLKPSVVNVDLLGGPHSSRRVSGVDHHDNPHLVHFARAGRRLRLLFKNASQGALSRAALSHTLSLHAVGAVSRETVGVVAKSSAEGFLRNRRLLFWTQVARRATGLGVEASGRAGRERHVESGAGDPWDDTLKAVLSVSSNLSKLSTTTGGSTSNLSETAGAEIGEDRDEEDRDEMRGILFSSDSSQED